MVGKTDPHRLLSYLGNNHVGGSADLIRSRFYRITIPTSLVESADHEILVSASQAIPPDEQLLTCVPSLSKIWIPWIKE